LFFFFFFQRSYVNPGFTLNLLICSFCPFLYFQRPSAAAALRHPLFWSAPARLNLLLDVSDAVEVMASDQVIYICIYVYIYVYICVCVYIYIYICVCVYIYACIYIYIYILIKYYCYYYYYYSQFAVACLRRRRSDCVRSGIGPYKILVYLEAVVHESSILACPPPRPPALPTLVQYYCTMIGQYTTPLPTSRVYAIHLTILAITVSCQDQIRYPLIKY